MGFFLDRDVLYKKGKDHILLRCVNASEAKKIVITVSRSTWMTTKIKWSRHRSFLYGCDRSPEIHVFKLGTKIPNLK